MDLPWSRRRSSRGKVPASPSPAMGEVSAKTAREGVGAPSTRASLVAPLGPASGRTFWLESEREWLEADGLGGFASGTTSGVRTRRYHALLEVASTPPTGRVVLVAALEAWLRLEEGGARSRRVDLSTHRYGPDVLHPSGIDRLCRFDREPFPTWTFTLEEDVGASSSDALYDPGARVRFSLFAPRGASEVVLVWRLEGLDEVELFVRPLLAGRDAHHALRERDGFDFAARVVSEGNVSWRPRPGVPPVSWVTNGAYRHEPTWYRRFLYAEERDRGLDAEEDLASPGVFAFALRPDSPAFALLRPGDAPYGDAEAICPQHELAERDRRGERSPTDLMADAYLVRRGRGHTVVAGYPWFSDWGRDTFIALRGLCLSTGRYREAASILSAWAGAVSEGMLPNRFPDSGPEPEYNAADASLWFVLCVDELLERAPDVVSARERARWANAVIAIIDGYAAGTRFGIRVDRDGLLAAGEPGIQLTWMDAKVGDRVITPRTGKPVELQALWVNALAGAARLAEGRTEELLERREAALRTFPVRFLGPGGRMADVVDVDHQPGTEDFSLRPNALFAVGGLPEMLVGLREARTVVDALEAALLTPYGLRTLDPSHPSYRPRYRGNVLERDEAYHQGTVWPWLMGPFVDAWLRTRTAEERAEDRHLEMARRRFLAPLTRLAERTGHLPEVLDGDFPHRAGGAPFQAWSAGEWLRITKILEQPSKSAT